VSRRRRRRGPGSRRGAGRRRPRRTILITRVAPTGDVNIYSPTIQAYVEDRNGSPLSRHDIDVYVDGKEMRFNYGRSSGSLRCSPGKLSSGTHTVEIEASTDDAVGRKRWTFNVKK
jgi:hypothetical protein